MEISPTILEFSGNFQQPTTEYLTITNPTDTPLAYKVKTTAPKLYCVRPNASVIGPGSSAQISIILQGFSEPLPKDYKCKDKFLIVSLPCPDYDESVNVSEVWAELESKYKEQSSSKKLRVNYLIENASSTSNSNSISSKSAKNDTSEPADTSVATASGIVASAQVDKSQPAEDLKRELDESETRINDLAKKLDSNAKPSSSTSTTNTTSTPSNTKTNSEDPVSGFSLQFAFILILIAFFLGWVLL